MRSKKIYLACFALLSFSAMAGAQEGSSFEVTDSPSYEQYVNRQVRISVPPGNRNQTMPAYGESTAGFLTRYLVKRNISPDEAELQQMKAIELKYQNSIRVLKKENVIAMVKEIAPLYGVAPIHVLGAIVGEHTFNVDIFDRLQSYSVRLEQWTNYLGSNRHKVVEVVENPAYRDCGLLESRYEYWTCLMERWEKKNGGSFMMRYFDPTMGGKTYGLGQMSPLRALMLTDIVRKVRPDFPELTPYDASELYETVLTPERAVHYVAANIAVAIHYYRKIAGFDLANNPGVTATLYNLGREKKKATELYEANKKSLQKNGVLIYPKESHYGWWINYKQAELEEMLK